MAQENHTPDPEIEAMAEKAVASVLGTKEEVSVSEQAPQEAVESVSTDESGTEAALPAEPAEPTKWYGDDDSELAKSYDLTVDDFTSREEFSRFTRLLDKQLLSAVKPVEQQVQQQPNQPLQFAPPPAQPQAQQQTQAPAETTKPKFAKLDLAKLKEAGYDPESLEHFAQHNAVVEHLEQLEKDRAAEREQFQAFTQYVQYNEQRWQQQESVRDVNHFHTIVDSLNDARFGKAFDERGRVRQLSDSENAVRQQLWETYKQFETSYQQSGKPIPAREILIPRAKNYAFAEDIAKEAVAKRNQEIAEQSKRRRPVQQARTPSGQFTSAKPFAQMSQHERISHVASDPDLQSLWQKFQETNGAAV